ncbi:MAG: hypothetical protein RLZZ393_1276 [Pseudomonadota bacterium]|jgi:NAD(P)H-hydrate epimerase
MTVLPVRPLTDADIAAALPARPRDAQKADFGRVLVVGGGTGMPGAARLAAEAALRVGAGLVTVASLPEHLAAVVGPRPELMFQALPDATVLPALLPQFDVVVIGPGLGRSDWSRSVLDTVLSRRPAAQPLVVDADALNLLASMHDPGRDACWILTPHPGEAARLLGTTGSAVQSDRVAAVEQLVARLGGVVVLKGAGTLVAGEGEPTVRCDAGNPGMAVPGMGDVLAGAIAGILAQCRRPILAARAAVQAHARAGDRLAAEGERGILAGEVATALRWAVNARGPGR